MSRDTPIIIVNLIFKDPCIITCTYTLNIDLLETNQKNKVKYSILT